MELVRDLSFKQVPHRLAGLLLKMSENTAAKPARASW